MSVPAGGTVLVLEAGKPNALSVIRDLGRAGVSVTAGESYRFATGGLSRYCSGTLLYPPIETQRREFQQWLLREGGRFGMLFPLSDLSTAAVLEISPELGRKTVIGAAPPEKYALVLDKAETARITTGAGVPAPRTWAPRDELELESLYREFTWPLVVKPRIGQYWDGERFSINKITVESFVRTPEELLYRWRQVHSRCPRPVLQEFIPGEGVGYFALLRGGKLYAQFAHRRLREYPITGGSSCFREGVPCGEISEIARKMLEALEWDGVAMLEFRRDSRDGSYKLLEVNGRWWGSLPLALASGVNFPRLYYSLLEGGDPEPVLDYPAGRRCRLLLPNDLLWLAASLVRRKDRLTVLREFFDFSNQSFDILSIEDPLPTLGALWTMARHLVLIAAGRETFSGEYRNG